MSRHNEAKTRRLISSVYRVYIIAFSRIASKQSRGYSSSRFTTTLRFRIISIDSISRQRPIGRNRMRLLLRLTWSSDFWTRSGLPRFPSFSLGSWGCPAPLADIPWLLIDPSRPRSCGKRIEFVNKKISHCDVVFKVRKTTDNVGEFVISSVSFFADRISQRHKFFSILPPYFSNGRNRLCR